MAPRAIRPYSVDFFWYEEGFDMEVKSLAAIYKKIKLCEGIYIYKFMDIVEPIHYDGFRDTIQYVKNGNVKEVPDMEDFEFTLSDDKICFSDMVSLDLLMDDYETEDIYDIKEQFKNDLLSFVRYGIVEEKEDKIKIVQSRMEDIAAALPDSEYLSYSSYSFDEDVQVSMPFDLLKSMVSNLEKGNVEMVSNQLHSMSENVENGAQYFLGESEEDMDEEPCPQDTTMIEEDTRSSLMQLIGLKSIKNKILQLEHFLEFMNKTKNDLKLKIPNMNMVFTGNPGTGKTTVARLVTSILYQNGVIEKPTFAELTTQNFIAGYVGQTAIKTKKVLESNRGGVIFIDEAYSFNGEAQQYAEEALVEILKEMEMRQTVFIFAGYPEEMKNFIESNPGFQSRIGYYIDFPNYSLDELWQIFELKATTYQFYLSEDLKDAVEKIITKYIDKPKFGNGRFIDQLLERIIINHANRMVDISNKEELCTLSAADMDDSIIEELNVKMKNKNIGF